MGRFARREPATLIVARGVLGNDRQARISFAELEVPSFEQPVLPRTYIFHAHPTYPKSAIYGTGPVPPNFHISTPGKVAGNSRQVRISFAEFETPDFVPRPPLYIFHAAPTPPVRRQQTNVLGHGWVIETNDRQARISFAELELPDAVFKPITYIFHAVPTPQARLQQSNVASHGTVVATNDRQALISFAEFEVPSVGATFRQIFSASFG